MKSVAAIIFCALPFVGHALEYEKQHEDARVRVSKVTVQAGEELGLHRDEFPRVVVGLKGGTFTRIEADGSAHDIHFPTGAALFLEADPAGQQHRGVNSSNESLELIVIELKK